MKRHTIRLRGPWQVAIWHDIHSRWEEGRRVILPCSWATAVGNNVTAAKFLRRFQLPTGLNERQSVLLETARVGGKSTWKLNGETVAFYPEPESSVSIDVTHRLQSSNTLEVEIWMDDRLDEHLREGLPEVVVLIIAEDPN